MRRSAGAQVKWTNPREQCTVLHSRARGVATVTLNRPEVGNAYNGRLIESLLAAMDELSTKPELGVVLVRGNGKRQAGGFVPGAPVRGSPEENVHASRITAGRRPAQPPAVPTVALVQGGCFGGGTGIVAACDVVIAADNALFSISEVRWGLTAASSCPSCATPSRCGRCAATLTGERLRRRGAAHRPGAPGGAGRPPRCRRRGDGGAPARKRPRRHETRDGWSAWGSFDRDTRRLVDARRSRQTEE
jgi:enoyl-CoA hydratase/carnithine racemase